MPMRVSWRWASATASLVSPDQRDRRAPGDQPAQVGGELVAQGDPNGAGDMLGGVGRALAQVHDPLAVSDPLAQLFAVDHLDRAEVGSVGSGLVEWAHVGVVAWIGAKAAHQPVNEVVLRGRGERVVGAAFGADGARVRSAGRA